MARIRSIKPEFWTSAQVMECSPNARLLFIGLWNFCDDAGRHQMSPKRIKAEVFPGDDFSAADVQRMLGELVANGLIETYTVDGEDYFVVTGWHHQKIDKPQKPKYPGPDESRSRNGSGMVATDLKDRIGEEKKERLLPASPPASPRKLDGSKPPRRQTDEAFERFRAAYPKRKGDYEWRTARERFDRAIRDGTDPEAIIAGAARYAAQQRELGHEGTPYVKQASSFMSARTWEEFSTAPPPANGATRTFDPRNDDDAKLALAAARARMQWSTAKWGAKPNTAGCEINPALILPTDGDGWSEWGT